MANTLLIGKDLPDCLDFSQALTLSERSVFTCAKNGTDTSSFETASIFSSEWNKASAISAHSFLIKAETKFTNIDEVIFYFDANDYCSKFETDKIEEVSSAVDTMISSYLYMTNELIKRADQRNEKLLVSFLVKEYPSKEEFLNNNSKYPNTIPASILVSSAQAAFVEMATNFATYVSDREYLSVLLAKCQFNNEAYKNEKAIATWLTDAITTIESHKNKQTVKQACTWNKVGSKVQIGFSLFK